MKLILVSYVQILIVEIVLFCKIDSRKQLSGNISLFLKQLNLIVRHRKTRLMFQWILKQQFDRIIDHHQIEMTQWLIFINIFVSNLLFFARKESKITTTYLFIECETVFILIIISNEWINHYIWPKISH